MSVLIRQPLPWSRATDELGHIHTCEWSPPSLLSTHSWSSLLPHTDTKATLTQPEEWGREKDTCPVARLCQSESPSWILTLKLESSFCADLSKHPPFTPLQRWAAGKDASVRSSSSHSTCSDSSQARSTPVRLWQASLLRFSQTSADFCIYI